MNFTSLWLANYETRNAPAIRFAKANKTKIRMATTLVIASSAFLGCSPTRNEQKELPKYRDRYEQGVNDALMTFALLNLEQQLQGTNRNFGEMSKIVCQRLSVQHDRIK